MQDFGEGTQEEKLLAKMGQRQEKESLQQPLRSSKGKSSVGNIQKHRTYSQRRRKKENKGEEAAASAHLPLETLLRTEQVSCCSLYRELQGRKAERENRERSREAKQSNRVHDSSFCCRQRGWFFLSFISHCLVSSIGTVV